MDKEGPLSTLVEEDNTDPKIAEEPKSDEEPPKAYSRVLVELQRWWFLIGIGLSVLLGYFFSSYGKKGGLLKSEITAQVAIALIFFLSGTLLKTQVMLKALLQWRLHVFIQVFSFVFFPLFTFAIVKLLQLAHFDQGMANGFLFLACVPTTISSNVVVTHQAEGNVAAAIFNAALGNSIGVVVSPSVLYVLYWGSATFSRVQMAATFLDLFETVILPLLVGQVARIAYLKAFKTEIPIVSQFGPTLSAVFLLYVLFCSFAQAFATASGVSAATILGTLGIAIFLQLAMVGIAFAVTSFKFWNFSRADRIAAVFCAPQKTLSIGLVLIDSMFGNDPTMALIVVPLVIYNPVQILFSGFLAPKMKEWKLQEPFEYRPLVSSPISVNYVAL